jgi:cyclophilin family peptidyl-prolyl cis-trans isomerase
MSRDRRQNRRGRKPRQRRPPPTATYERVGHVQYPGVFGWFQRNQRLFFLIGAFFLIASLGASTCVFQANTANDDDATPTATASPTAEPSETATPTPTGTATTTATATPTEPVLSWDEPPPMTIDITHSYEAVIETEKGTIRIELLPEDAPGYVNNFVFLARAGFYDGLTFHRVIPGFVAQAGDPTATGFGGSGYSLEQETNDLPFDEGVIAMATSDAGVSGSQFFITTAPASALEPNFDVFGRVVEGIEVARALTPRDPSQPSQPPGDRILSVEIVEGS